MLSLSCKDGSAQSTLLILVFLFSSLFHIIPVSFIYFTIIFWQYYQNLFRNGECFLHIVSLLNGTFDEAVGEQLVLNVLQTLTTLLAENDESKVRKYLAISDACVT